MSRLCDEFYKFVEKSYPIISAKADEELNQRWGGSIDFRVFSHFSHLWFESLADTINYEMNLGTPVSEFCSFFLTIKHYFENGDEDIRNCIDVSFVENLFYGVPKDKASPYWHELPEVLKNLYLNFHSKPPI